MEDITGLRKSGKELEESFFTKENAKLLEQLREQGRKERKRNLLRDALKIDDERTLDHLVALDISAETIVAFGLVPLVEVAWADGAIQPKERAAILKAAEERGITAGTINHKLLENWLKQQPKPVLLEVWRHYAKGLHRVLEPSERTMLRERVLGNARNVAQTAGGFLGLGAISAAEQAVLEDLEATFA